MRVVRQSRHCVINLYRRLHVPGALQSVLDDSRYGSMSFHCHRDDDGIGRHNRDACCESRVADCRYCWRRCRWPVAHSRLDWCLCVALASSKVKCARHLSSAYVACLVILRLSLSPPLHFVPVALPSNGGAGHVVNEMNSARFEPRSSDYGTVGTGSACESCACFCRFQSVFVDSSGGWRVWQSADAKQS